MVATAGGLTRSPGAFPDTRLTSAAFRRMKTRPSNRCAHDLGQVELVGRDQLLRLVARGSPR